MAASLARRLKVPLEKVRARVVGRFWSEGSALAGTLQTGCDGFDLELEVESPAPPEEIARLVRLASAGCYVEQALAHATPVRTRVILNGDPLDR